MSQETVRREIAAKRAYADQLERRARDTAHPFADPRHADHLLVEAQRLRAEADREEQHLLARAGQPATAAPPPAAPPSSPTP